MSMYNMHPHGGNEDRLRLVASAAASASSLAPSPAATPPPPNPLPPLGFAPAPGAMPYLPPLSTAGPAAASPAPSPFATHSPHPSPATTRKAYPPPPPPLSSSSSHRVATPTADPYAAGSPHPSLLRLAQPAAVSVWGKRRLRLPGGASVPLPARPAAAALAALLVLAALVYYASTPATPEAGGYLPPSLVRAPGGNGGLVVSGGPAAVAAAAATSPPGTWYPAAGDVHSTSLSENVVHQRSVIDATYGFVDREPGNVERMVSVAGPRPRELRRKLGLIAIPAGRKAKPMVDRLVRRFGMADFSFMIFHWDNSTWDDLPWYKNAVAVRAIGQTKFYFAKRFLTPDVVQNYDYIWLWDDDIEPESYFDPVAFTQLLKDYHVHFAQPSLTWGEHGLQGPVVRKRDGGQVGRFSTFVEVMLPIISRGAWPCAWRVIPWDARATWGVDNAWYPACGAYGYCRFAIIDALPVKHMDTRTFENTMETNLAELNAYTAPFFDLCAAADASKDATLAWPLSTFCRWWFMRDSLLAFDTVRKMTPADRVNVTTCPDAVDFPNVENVPWWHIR
ncbi:hypothetical protein H9P43_005988 [Blastocladiella emersonii ATCC 22665]|nr:hypothetical protein H9P43_005988 [Blastocladiella emersonii ATCC 22665]